MAGPAALLTSHAAVVSASPAQRAPGSTCRRSRPSATWPPATSGSLSAFATRSVPAVSRRRPGAVAAAVSGTDSKSRMEEWDKVRETLAKSVKSITPQEAADLVAKGKYKILDVRPAAEYEDVHPEGAVNAQRYRLIKNWSTRDVMRRLGFAFFGVFNGTEDNPDFIEEVKQVAKPEEGLIVACMMGGTLKPSTNFPQGKESRSLNAAYVLVTNGYKNVLHMDGGLNSYFRADLPVVFKED